MNKPSVRQEILYPPRIISNRDRNLNAIIISDTGRRINYLIMLRILHYKMQILHEIMRKKLYLNNPDQDCQK